MTSVFGIYTATDLTITNFLTVSFYFGISGRLLQKNRTNHKVFHYCLEPLWRSTAFQTASEICFNVNRRNSNIIDGWIIMCYVRIHIYLFISVNMTNFTVSNKICGHILQKCSQNELSKTESTWYFNRIVHSQLILKMLENKPIMISYINLRKEAGLLFHFKVTLY